MAAVESSLKEGSVSKAYCDDINQQTVISYTFSEMSRPGTSKGEGHSRGTPTMFAEINNLKGRGVQPDKSTHDRGTGTEWKSSVFDS